MASLLLDRSARPVYRALAHRRYVSTRDGAMYSPRSDFQYPPPHQNEPPEDSEEDNSYTRASSVTTDSPETPEVHPGKHVITACRLHNFAFPNKMARIKGMKIRNNNLKLGAAVSERHCMEKNTMKFLDKVEHPFAKSILNMYISRKDKPLWYTTHAHPVASSFPCHKAESRILNAFREALAAHGYDRDGRKVNTEDVIVDLYGTVHLTCGDPRTACNIKFRDVVSKTMDLVSHLELALGRDKHGQHIQQMDRQNLGRKPNSKTPRVKKYVLYQ
ncbi:hypothetical protein GGR52DRAFT_481764 [Hypoxylon sp. FL1284]|nr:hypothetical protein GGR52DRAFT_481764 [Hypoxylon sp. FL1284]